MNMKKSGILQRVVKMVLAFWMMLLPVNDTFALSSSTLDRFAENNILFYDPGSRGCPNGTFREGPIAIVGNTAAEKIWSGLTSFLTPEQAAGVMGNMLSESGLHPARHETSQMNSRQPGFDLGSHADVSYGLGLIQWSFGRRVGLYNYIRESDSSLLTYLDDYNTYSRGTATSGDGFLQVAGSAAFDALASLELQYLKDELNSSYRGIFNASTVYDAAKFFLENVEIPQNPRIESHPNRVTQAEAFYSQFAGGGVSNGSGAASVSYGSSCYTNLGSLEEYVRAYVWPEHHNPVFLERMPAYAEAVSRRASAGKYVGGTVGGVPGIDCGGFVTTIMQESGFDPTYNGCSSNTGPQEYWLREGGGSDKWVWLNPHGERMNAADLQLGDVAFTDTATSGYPGSCSPGGGHTYMFIGNISGFQTNIASASYGSTSRSARAPMSGTEGIGGAKWYRKVR